MNNPAVSIVIPTRNRRELLGRMLDSLARVQAVPGEMEVLIVDDGSTDGTAAALAARKDPFPLRLLRHDRPAGPAAARNHGAREARGGILGFLDSDIAVDPGWWQAARRHFDQPEVAGVEGATITPAGSPQPTIFTHVVANPRGGNFLTCNILYRREVFQALGGFDERFLRANREDSDLAFTVLERGYRIVFEPACRVEHPLVPAPYGVFWQETRLGLHEALLRRKHPRMYRAHLKWIDGRAFPVFYWGLFLGLPLALAGWGLGTPLALYAGVVVCGLGWSGAIYARCRRRRFRWGDLVILSAQMLLIPWVRLYWIWRGEWRFRGVSASPESKRRAIEQ
jgi:glycosyltransferase involved in cell wall biosynthesis